MTMLALHQAVPSHFTTNCARAFEGNHCIWFQVLFLLAKFQ